ncbi:L-rhamnose mutarotase [Mariniphaga sediminis]|uniref:L-rhamnose mutarotase n=1 Tax=Mariniphaga sediminis TaxID=1628158 RepID=UPI0035679CA5
MIRKAFLIHAKPGMAVEYEKRHNPIWAELEKVLKAGGISNYSIFLHEETNALFGYMEVEDEEKFQQIGEADVARRWWKYMTEVLICESEDSEKGKEDILREVFRLD